MIKLTFGGYKTLDGRDATMRITINGPEIVNTVTGDVHATKITVFGKTTWEVELPATDDPNNTPQGFTYEISVNGKTKNVSLPRNVPVVDYDTLKSVPAEIGEVFYPPTYPGPRGFKGEKGDKGDRGLMNKNDLDSIMGGDVAGLAPKVATLNSMATNVKSYAAKGDFITDDSSAIRAALAAGKDVFLPPGVYRLESSVIIPAGKTIRGAGCGATMIFPVGAISAFVMSNDTSISDMFITGNSNGVTHGVIGSVGIDVPTDTHHYSLSGVNFSALDVGIRSNRSYIATVYNSIIRGCRTGVLFTNSNNNSIVFFGGEIVSCVTGVKLTGYGSKVIFHGVTIEGNVSGVHVNGGYYATTFLDCYFEENSSVDIWQDSAAFGTSIRGCSISGPITNGPHVVIDRGLNTNLSDNVVFNTNASSKWLTIGALAGSTILSNNYVQTGVQFSVIDDFAGYRLTLDGSLIGKQKAHTKIVPKHVGEIYTDVTASLGVEKWVSTGLTSADWKVHSGDTGWWNLDNILGGGATGTLRYNRSNNVVTMCGVITTPTAQAAKFTLRSLTEGFRPKAGGQYSATGIAVSSTGENVGVLVSQGSLSFAKATAGAVYTFGVRWDCDDPWPTSIPGTLEV